MHLITTLRPAENTPATEHRYQPARPLSRMNLFDFKTLDDNFGEDPMGQSLERIDPILQHSDEGLHRLGDQVFFRKSLEQLFVEHPFGESRPPLTLDQQPR